MNINIVNGTVFCKGCERIVNLTSICQESCPLYETVTQNGANGGYTVKCRYDKEEHNFIEVKKFILDCPKEEKVSKVYCINTCLDCKGDVLSISDGGDYVNYVICGRKNKKDKEMPLTADIADKEKMKELCFITVTVQSKQATNSDTTGLFVSIKPLIDNENGSELVDINDQFVWIFRNKCAHMFSLEYYNITRISMGYGEKCENSIAIPYDDHMQERAVSELKAILEILKEENQTSARDLVIFDRAYKNIPTVLAKDLDLDIKGSSTTNTGNVNSLANRTGTGSAHTSRSGAVNYGTTGGTNTGIYNGSAGSTATNYTITTAVIKRTTEYTVDEAMAKIKAKIHAIKDGSYEAPVLKTLEIDKDAEEATESTSKPDVPSIPSAADDVGHADDWSGWPGRIGSSKHII